MTHPFGEVVRAERLRAGLSLRAMGKLVGVSHVYLGKVERGVSPPLNPKYWPALSREFPTLTGEYLEHLAFVSAPIRLDVSSCDPATQEVVRVLARRIRDRNFDEELAQEIIDILVAG